MRLRSSATYAEQEQVPHTHKLIGSALNAFCPLLRWQTGLRKSRDYSSAVARLAAKWQQQGQAQEQGQGQAQEQAHQQGREQGKQEGRRRRVHIRHRQLQEAFGESGRGSGRGRLVGEEAGAGEGGGGVTALVPAGWDESRLDFGTVKAIYDRHAPLKKVRTLRPPL